MLEHLQAQIIPTLNPIHIWEWHLKGLSQWLKANYHIPIANTCMLKIELFLALNCQHIVLRDFMQRLAGRLLTPINPLYSLMGSGWAECSVRKSVLRLCWQDEHRILTIIAQQGICGQWLRAMTHEDAGWPAPAWAPGLTQRESYLILRKTIPLQKLWRGIVLSGSG